MVSFFFPSLYPHKSLFPTSYQFQMPGSCRRLFYLFSLWAQRKMWAWSSCKQIDKGWDTTMVLAVLQMNGWCVVSEGMLVCMLSVSVTVVKCCGLRLALALAPFSGDLKPEGLLRPFLRVWVSKKLICPDSSSVSLSFPLEPDQTWTGWVFHSKSFVVGTNRWQLLANLSHRQSFLPLSLNLSWGLSKASHYPWQSLH